MSTHALVPLRPTAAKARVHTRAPEALLQRKCECGGSAGHDGECEDCKKKKLQRRAIGHGPGTAPSIVHDVLRSSGQPLDAATRQFFEPRFSHDFSRVRIHADEKAAHSAREVSALAYTVGSNVVFAAGQYRPSSPAGRQLIAHELTHVVQQSHSSSRGHAGSILLDAPANPLEAQAERTSAAVMSATRNSGGKLGATIHSTGLLQRAPADPAPAKDQPPAPKAEFSDCDKDLQDDLRAKQAPALDHANRAITALSKGWKDMDPGDQGSFRQFFDPSGSGEIDDSFVKDVRSNYQIIHGYMQNLSFACNPGDHTLCGTSASLCRKGGNLMWTCFGALHVCPGPYRTATDAFKIETMIHESTHNALHTTDREYHNSPDFNRLKPRGSLGWRFLRNIPIFGYLFRFIRANNDTILNPDSYAGFAMKAGGQP
jgi:hypothetical protein